MRIGSISSDVDKYIEKRVPKVITLAAYKLDAKAEKPHWGIMPNEAPAKGPNLLMLDNFFLLVNLCSINSIITNDINKKGINFKASIIESIIISFISFSLSNILFAL